MKRIAIFGAGAIGGYLTQHWAGALAKAGVGLDVIGRGALLERLKGAVPGPAYHSDPAVLARADVVMLTLKSTGLEAALPQIAQHVRPGAVVIALLNGLAPARRIRAALPEHCVLAGMVPFNVVWTEQGLHRSSAGDVVVADHPATRELVRLTAETQAPLTCSQDIEAAQHGKLLLNLINPINALSGLRLYPMLQDRGYRLIYSDALSEALAAYDAAGIVWHKIGPFSPNLSRVILRLPDGLFNRVILPIQKIDRATRTSMASDLRAGRITEIDDLNGEITRIAARAGTAAHVNAGLVRLIQAAAPQSALSATALRDRL